MCGESWPQLQEGLWIELWLPHCLAGVPRKRNAVEASRVALGGAWGTLAHTGLPSKGVKSDSFAAEDTEVPLGKTGGAVQN